MVLSCKNEDCDYSKTRKDYGDHDQNCPHELMRCKWCNNFEAKRKDIDEH